MSNKLRSIRRAMTQKQMKQIPAKMVPIFGPVYDQLERVVAIMNKERKVLETPDSPAEPPTNIVNLVNSTLAQAVNNFHHARKIKEDKKSQVQLVGSEVLGKIRAGEKEMERRQKVERR